MQARQGQLEGDRDRYPELPETFLGFARRYDEWLDRARYAHLLTDYWFPHFDRSTIQDRAVRGPGRPDRSCLGGDPGVLRPPRSAARHRVLEPESNVAKPGLSQGPPSPQSGAPRTQAIRQARASLQPRVPEVDGPAGCEAVARGSSGPGRATCGRCGRVEGALGPGHPPVARLRRDGGRQRFPSSSTPGTARSSQPTRSTRPRRRRPRPCPGDPCDRCPTAVLTGSRRVGLALGLDSANGSTMRCQQSLG